MRKKHLILLGLLVFCVVLSVSVALISGHSRNNYARVLPDDCQWLVCVQLPELMSETGIDPAQIQSLADMEEYHNYGLALDLPVYFFATASQRMCLLLPLSDVHQLEEWLSSQQAKVETQRGLRWTAFRQWTLCFDSDRLLVMETASGQENAVRKEMYKLMTTEHEAMPFAQAMKQVQGSVRLACNTSQLSHLAAKDIRLGALPVSAGKGAILVAGCKADTRTLTLESHLLDPDQELDNLTAVCKRVLRPVDGSRLNLMPADALFAVGVNVNGGEALKLLRQQKELRMLLAGLNLCIDADKILGSIDGDMVLTVADASGALPHFRFCAEVNDNTILEGASSWSGFGNMKVVGHGANACELQWNGNPLSLRVKDNILSVANVASYDVLCTEKPAAPLPPNTYLVATLSPGHFAAELPVADMSDLERLQLVIHAEGLQATLMLASSWTEWLNRTKQVQNP